MAEGSEDKEYLDALKKASQATVALKKIIEKFESVIDGISEDEDDGRTMEQRMEFLSAKVAILAASPVVEGSVQLKPHVSYLVARLDACREKLARAAATTASTSATQEQESPPDEEEKSPRVAQNEQAQNQGEEVARFEQAALSLKAMLAKFESALEDAVVTGSEEQLQFLGEKISKLASSPIVTGSPGLLLTFSSLASQVEEVKVKWHRRMDEERRQVEETQRVEQGIQTLQALMDKFESSLKGSRHDFQRLDQQFQYLSDSVSKFSSSPLIKTSPSIGNLMAEVQSKLAVCREKLVQRKLAAAAAPPAATTVVVPAVQDKSSAAAGSVQRASFSSESEEVLVEEILPEPVLSSPRVKSSPRMQNPSILAKGTTVGVPTAITAGPPTIPSRESRLLAPPTMNLPVASMTSPRQDSDTYPLLISPQRSPRTAAVTSADATTPVAGGSRRQSVRLQGFDAVVGVNPRSSTRPSISQQTTPELEYKLKFDEMVKKFEAAKALIVTMQEKQRRMEADVGDAPALRQRIDVLESRQRRLRANRDQLEVKIPQLNTRVVSLEMELEERENTKGARGKPVFTVGEHVWAKPPESTLWFDAVVLQTEGDDHVSVRIVHGHQHRDVRLLPSASVRKVGMVYMGVDETDYGVDEEDDSSTWSAASAASSSDPAQKEISNSMSAVSGASGGTGGGGAAAAAAAGGSSRLNASDLKSKVGQLFGRGHRTDRSPTVSAAGTPPTSDKDKRSIFKLSVPSSSLVDLSILSPGSSAAPPPEPEIAANGMGLGEVSRIYASDLWAAVMDAQSSDTLLEVFFLTYDYHSTWEQVLGTMTSIFNESHGSSPELIGRRTRVLFLLRRWVAVQPDVIRAKASPDNAIKNFSFSDPASLTGESDEETLAVRGKMIVGDYGTARKQQVMKQTRKNLAHTPSSPRRRAGSTTPAPSSETLAAVTQHQTVSPMGLAPSTPVPASVPRSASPPPLPELSGLDASHEAPTGGSSDAQLGGAAAATAAVAEGVDESGESEFSDDLLDDDTEVTIDHDDGKPDDASSSTREERHKTARRKGRELYQSIGNLYKDLKMDKETLDKNFKDGAPAAAASVDAEGSLEEGGKNFKTVARLSFSMKPTFLQALARWVDMGVIQKDEDLGDEREIFLREYESWKKPAASRGGKRGLLGTMGRDTSSRLFVEARAMSSMAITQFSADAVARQLFLEEWELFHGIKEQEFRRLRFMEVTTGHGFQYMVWRFNTWCLWIATEILLRPTPAERAAVIEFFIDVGVECNNAHNFNSSYAVIGALNHPSIARLKFTWKRVSKKSMRVYAKLLAFWSTSSNMAAYRAELKRVKPPAVPYLGLIGKDLFQVEMGTPTILSLKTDTDWVLNFHKLRSLAQQIHMVSTLQRSDPPNWGPNMDIATCISAVVPLSDDDAYKRSLELEPRGCESESQLPSNKVVPASGGRVSQVAVGSPPPISSGATSGVNALLTRNVSSKNLPPAATSPATTPSAAAATSTTMTTATPPGPTTTTNTGTTTAATTTTTTTMAATTPPSSQSTNRPSLTDLPSLKGSSELISFLANAEALSGTSGGLASLADGHESFLASVAFGIYKEPEFAVQGGRRSVQFSIQQLVNWLCRVLALLEPGKRYDVAGIEATKQKAVYIFEGMRQLGLVVSSKNVAAQLVGAFGTLRSGLTGKGFVKADDKSVWCIAEEELSVYGVPTTVATPRK